MPRWRSARPDPHNGAGLKGHFAPEVFGTPIDCQAHLPFTTHSSSHPAAFCQVRISICLMLLSPGSSCSFARGGARPTRFAPSLRPMRRRRHWNGGVQEGLAATPRLRCRSLPTRAWRIARPESASCAGICAALRDAQELWSSTGGGLTRHEAPTMLQGRVPWRTSLRRRPQRPVPWRSAPRCRECRQTPSPHVGSGHAANSASKEAMRRSSSSQRVRISSSRNTMRGLSATASVSSNSPSKNRSRAYPCATTCPRSKSKLLIWLVSEVRSPTRRSRTR